MPESGARRAWLGRIPPEISALCLGLFWPLEMLAANLGQVQPSEIPRPFLVIVVVLGVATVVLGRVAGSRVAGAYVAVVWAMLFWGASAVSEAGEALGVSPGYGPACFALVLLGGLAAARGLGRYLAARPDSGARLGGLLAIVAGVFFLPTFGACCRHLLAAPPPPLTYPPLPSASPRGGVGTPDVYMILLDGYGRDDVLASLYGVDDGAFRRRLEGLGFHVARAAQSNYVSTQQSMASVLNLGYLPDMSVQARVSPRDQRPLQETLRSPGLFQLARARGYGIRYIGSGSRVWVPDAFDRYLDPGLSPLEHFYLTLSGVGEAWPGAFHRIQRDRLRATVAAGPVPEGAPPTWTLLHLMAPHPPFVFDASGRPFDDAAPFLFTLDRRDVLDEVNAPGYYTRGYGAQVQHVGKMVGDLVEGILSRPGRPALVWIFGDHGPRATELGDGTEEEVVIRERTGILHALHVPPGLELAVPEDTTLVQTSRALARALFGLELPPVPARFFYHAVTNNYALKEWPRVPRADATPWGLGTVRRGG